MKPILFEANETTFTSNGIGRLSDAISCLATEVRNGLFEVELKYPVKGTHFNDIVCGRVIYCTHDATKIPQAFDIYSVSKPSKGVVTARGRHITYRLSNIVTMPVAGVGIPAQQMFDTISENIVGASPFTFWSDIAAEGTMTADSPTTVRGLLGDGDNTILSVWGGEYKWNMFQVQLFSARGSDRGVKIRTGKNVKQLVVDGDTTEIVTGVIPWWVGPSDLTGDDVYVDLPEKVIQSSDASLYPYQITKPLDMSDVWEHQPTVAELRAGATEWLNRNIYNTRNRVAYAVDMTSEDVTIPESMRHIELCDLVTVQDAVLGVDTKLKVVKTVWDVLRDRYSRLEIGTTLKTLAYDFRLRNQVILQKLEVEETKTTTVAKTASANGTERHVESQLQNPQSALARAIAQAGGSQVTITPTISTGTKIADYDIDGVAGELYAPSGGGGGGGKTYTYYNVQKKNVSTDVSVNGRANKWTVSSAGAWTHDITNANMVLRDLQTYGYPIVFENPEISAGQSKQISFIVPAVAYLQVVGDSTASTDGGDIAVDVLLTVWITRTVQADGEYTDAITSATMARRMTTSTKGYELYGVAYFNGTTHHHNSFYEFNWYTTQLKDYVQLVGQPTWS